MLMPRGKPTARVRGADVMRGPGLDVDDDDAAAEDDGEVGGTEGFALGVAACPNSPRV